MKCALFLSLFLCFGAATVGLGQVPQLISYQGRLTTAAGTNVADGNYSLTFRLYDVASGGAALWTETQNVAVSGGLFSVNFGAVMALSLAFDKPYWLGVTVAGGIELSPRTPLASAPYSYNSISSNSARSVTGTSTIINGNWAVPNLQLLNTGGGVALYGQSSKNASVAAIESDSPEKPAIPPTGHWGVYGEAMGSDTTGVGVIGVNGWSATEGDLGTWRAGVYGRSNSGNGVHGYAVGGANGVYGQSDMTSGNGVHGVANVGSAAYGVWGESDPGYGVVGRSTAGTGVYGASSSGYAGYFSGNVYVNGNLGKAAGGFKIDHPLDPANKYLQHSFVESPDMMNVYNGNETLDQDGAATVVLPDYLEALNQDFRYQLTAIGAPGPNLYVSQKVIGNQFKIAGGSPGMEVSWQVTGIRHDAWANAHRIQVEVDKQGAEQGKYLSPVEEGQPSTSGIDYGRVESKQ